MPTVLILYYSRTGGTRLLAEKIAYGAQMSGCDVMLRTVANVSPDTVQSEQPIPEHGAPYVTLDELKQCDALAVGSPTRFGNMAAAMKHFWDSTSALWLRGDLVDKPACVFASSASLHGGQETTLMSMMLPLLHHGMIICGLPYAVPELASTRSGGTPYGATHVSFNAESPTLTSDEIALAIAQGKRLAKLIRTN